MFNFGNKFPLKERATIAKRLAFLVRSGVPIVESLNILKHQQGSATKTKILEKVITDVAGGQYLSTSLAKFKNFFDPFAINILRVGEESGTLDQSLEYLAEELKKKQLLRKKIWSAMIYPVFIVIATLGITGLILFFVFPKILPIFKSLNLKLPLTTRALIFINDLVSKNFYLLLGLLVVIIITAFFLNQRQSTKFQLHSWLLRLPLFGGIARNYQLANLCRTIGLLLKSNVRVIKAFEIAAETSSNLLYQKQLRAISQDMNRGLRIAKSMGKQPELFPPLLSQMVTIGETTGRLDETFGYISELYENELEETTKNLSTLLEPVLMIFMGLIVGFIAISIISPIYAITQNLHP